MPRLIFLAALSGALAALLAGCTPHAAPTAGFGDPAHGRVVITTKACGSCHEIPGVSDAHGMVGPSLRHMAQRTVIAGVLPNTPPNMKRWLIAPQSIVPGNAMPNTELNDHDAQDVAAYLYTLR